jgi:hypothetical protein
MDDRGSVLSRDNDGMFLVTTSRLGLGLIQLPIQWVPRVKRPEREADHSYLMPRLGMRGAVSPLPQYFFMEWCLVRHKDNNFYRNRV